MARAAIDGIERGQSGSGMDVGAAEAPPMEVAVADVPAFKGIDAPRGEADDLKRIKGISPKLEQSLNDLGVFHFPGSSPTSMPARSRRSTTPGTRGRIKSDDWTGQAKKPADAAAV